MSNPVWFGLVARAQGNKTKHTDFFGLGFATLCESRPKVEEFAGWALISTAGARGGVCVCPCERASCCPNCGRGALLLVLGAAAAEAALLRDVRSWTSACEK